MGLLHRDLKPANIFLDKDNNIKLGDFGLAQEISKGKAAVSLAQVENEKENEIAMKKRFSGSDQAQKFKHLRNSLNPNDKRSKESNKISESMMSMGIGTYYYMSPEQETQRNYNQKTDMFSLGIILFEMYANMKSLMEKDRALKYLRTHFKIPPEYTNKVPKNSVQIIEQLISKNPDDRPSAEEVLKSEFSDPESSAANLALAQYTYFMDYPDFKCSFDTYSKENDIMNKVIKECKKVFELHGAKFMESAMFKPLTNSFTIFVHKLNYNPLDSMLRLNKKKSKKKGKIQANEESDTDSEYIKIDFATGERITTMNDQFGFEKQCFLTDKRRVEYMNAEDIYSHSSKNLANNLVENWARYLSIKNPGFIKRYCIDKVFDMPSKKNLTRCHPLKRWEASFDICVSRDKGYLYNEDEDEDINQEKQLMYEVEAINTSFEIISKYTKAIGNPKIIINSSVILDIIMEECDIEFKVRHKILSILSQHDRKSWNEIRKKLNELHSIPRKNVDKLGRLIKIEGDIEQVQKEIVGMKGLLYRK